MAPKPSWPRPLRRKNIFSAATVPVKYNEGSLGLNLQGSASFKHPVHLKVIYIQQHQSGNKLSHEARTSQSAALPSLDVTLSKSDQSWVSLTRYLFHEDCNTMEPISTMDKLSFIFPTLSAFFCCTEKMWAFAISLSPKAKRVSSTYSIFQ